MTTPFPGPTLTVDLSALRANYALLRKQFGGGECAAVVKANAYGLGVAEASKALALEGCKTFFVATLSEGIELRGVLPPATIGVFHGPYAGEEKDYLAHRLIPVLNSPEQVERFARHAKEAPRAEAMLHVDTGMNRLGLTRSEAVKLASRPELMRNAHITTILSHFACANEPENPFNAEQLARFTSARDLFPGLRASLCNSSGIFLEHRFHFDLARPGCSLYGINPGKPQNPMNPVVTLSAPIIQLREMEYDDTVGYGGTCRVQKGQRLATVQVGYSDGYFRHLSNIGRAFIHGQEVALLGRVSMDMVVVDVSNIPPPSLAPGQHVELINASYTVDDVAEAAGTIGYEVLTRMGRRIIRRYV